VETDKGEGILEEREKERDGRGMIVVSENTTGSG